MERPCPTPQALEDSGPEWGYGPALAWLLRAEGGYVNDPDDNGGATKYGITLQSWRDYNGRQDLTAEDVAAIGLEQAGRFYEAVYWRPLRSDQTARRTPLAARAIFDMAVLHGAPRVVRIAQRIVGVPEDGIVGPNTQAALAAMGDGPFLLHFCCVMTDRFVAIALADPRQIKFLRGWVGRSTRLLMLLGPPGSPMKKYA